jgi:hypothetical protein
MPSVRADRRDRTSRGQTEIATEPVLELTPVHRAFSAALSWVPVTGLQYVTFANVIGDRSY